ncbi:hypothetical protein cyc_07929 [Cyclospora cayetanensis]|uniref:Uncharacterized protein n=1 Tax=Cyclospora cayetanensis TaxID=88456 RepID=A0A1D3D2N3_9EIME|nr:hypothetical protein cyc_07929 [Cyclospora cayetanensis]
MRSDALKGDLLGGTPESFVQKFLREQEEAIYRSRKRMPLGRSATGLNPHHSNDVCCGVKQTPDESDQAKKCIWGDTHGPQTGGSYQAKDTEQEGPPSDNHPGQTLENMQQKRKIEKAAVASVFASRIQRVPGKSALAEGPPDWWEHSWESPSEESDTILRKGARCPLDGLTESFAFGVSTKKDAVSVADCMQDPEQQSQDHLHKHPQLPQHPLQRKNCQQQQIEQHTANQKDDHVWELLRPPRQVLRTLRLESVLRASALYSFISNQL